MPWVISTGMLKQRPVYRQALAINPGYLVALINLGRTLTELGRWAEAKACYRLAVQNYPDSGIAQ